MNARDIFSEFTNESRPYSEQRAIRMFLEGCVVLPGTEGAAARLLLGVISDRIDLAPPKICPQDPLFGVPA